MSIIPVHDICEKLALVNFRESNIELYRAESLKNVYDGQLRRFGVTVLAFYRNSCKRQICRSSALQQ
jgi:hypothetical protein